jgi:hypothetical protein
MTKQRLIPALLASLLFAPAANAAFTLIANGTLSPTASDLSGQTGLMENGVAGNLLGGIGSGLAWAGGNNFIATPDRGPNATAYNAAVDDTSSYISRFQTISMGLTANGGSGLAFNLTPTLTATTLLSSSSALVYGTGAGLGNKIDGITPIGSGAPALNATNGTNYFTGRSDNFDPAQLSTNPNNARLDPESIRMSNDGKSVFISDEYGPYVYQFDRATGQRINSFALPGNLAISNLSPVGATEIAGNTSGRVTNKGMEGLAITPDGKTLVGIMQAPLEQDTNKWVRIVTIDIASGATKEFGYKLTTGTGVSDIVAINDHEFLVDERDGKGLGDASAPNVASTLAVVKQIFKIDINGATDVIGINGNLNSASFTPVTKSASPVLNLVTALTAGGIAANLIPAKIEGIAFGEDVTIAGQIQHTLWIANDNDFLAQQTPNGTSTLVANPNVFYVFGFTDADLGSVLQKQSVPLPGTLLLLGSGLLGWMGASRKRSKS